MDPSVAVKAPYPCPCCGHLVFQEPPGSYDLCPICFWEDDAVQLRWPEYEGGANRPSLIDSQKNYSHLEAIEACFLVSVRPPTADEPIDPGWRPVDPATDDFEPRGERLAEWPDDLTFLYWWRTSYWRRQ